MTKQRRMAKTLAEGPPAAEARTGAEDWLAEQNTSAVEAHTGAGDWLAGQNMLHGRLIRDDPGSAFRAKGSVVL